MVRRSSVKMINTHNSGLFRQTECEMQILLYTKVQATLEWLQVLLVFMLTDQKENRKGETNRLYLKHRLFDKQNRLPKNPSNGRQVNRSNCRKLFFSNECLFELRRAKKNVRVKHLCVRTVRQNTRCPASSRHTCCMP